MTSSTEWIEKKINIGDITRFEYEELSNFVKIGEGGFGIVRRADITSRGIRVALKSLLTIKKNEIVDLVNEQLELKFNSNEVNPTTHSTDNDSNSSTATCVNSMEPINFLLIGKKNEYESDSKEIFNYLINNPKITQHSEVVIGKFYQEGFGTDKNQKEGFKWFLKACEKEDEHGKYEVGACYFHRRGIEKSKLKAKECFEHIINCGPNIALYKLANCYEFTISLEKEILIHKAIQLYKTSAEKGFITSQFKVAYHYSHGFYTQINEVEALKWYKLFQKNGGYPDVSEKIKKLKIYDK
ncbi:16386_t:CDS:2 [Funneliformis caledonium]|uniref:16386_t:CDS:1 n=1 Tax=Funneliformis caledonium TaxID=1117310 RepID=A0A9N9CGJ8_9GLOM|nr:16386_t:CDS:2 [Funneliformis caledonium]